ncbi:hypothetical protein M0802_012086 [Mischocyttarus mexicanus]|nr:hypothetical protein M0802_012086 [Mischocyttarus mexicanus]
MKMVGGRRVKSEDEGGRELGLVGRMRLDLSVPSGVKWSAKHCPEDVATFTSLALERVSNVLCWGYVLTYLS